MSTDSQDDVPRDEPNDADLAAILAAAIGRDLETDWARVAQALGTALLRAQQLEMTVRIAGPTLAADGAQPDVAGRAIHKNFGRDLIDVVRDLAGLLPREQVEELQRLRKRRNALAHEWLIAVLVGVVTGGADQLVTDLEELTSEFDAANQRLYVRLMKHAESIVDVGPLGVDGLGQMVLLQGALDPALFAGVGRLRDFDLVWERLAVAVEEDDNQLPPEIS